MITAAFISLQNPGNPELLTYLPDRQKFIAVSIAVAMLVVVIELVRRRKLREEYSILWFVTATLLLALAFWPRLLNLFCTAIGAKTPNAALFLGALIFLMLVSLLVSIRISRLTFRNKALGQQVSLQQREFEELNAKVARLRDQMPERKQETLESQGDFGPSKQKGIAKDGAA